MFPSQEEIFTAIEPIAKWMEEFGSNSMRVTLRDNEDVAMVSIVVARDDKAELVSRFMDLLDKAYDAGAYGESLDDLQDAMSEAVNEAVSVGRAAEANRPEEDLIDLDEEFDDFEDELYDFDEDDFDLDEDEDEEF